MSRSAKDLQYFPPTTFSSSQTTPAHVLLPIQVFFFPGLRLYTCHSTPSSIFFPNHYLHVLQAIRYLFQSIYSVFQPTKTLSIPLPQLTHNFSSFFAIFWQHVLFTSPSPCRRSLTLGVTPGYEGLAQDR